MRNIESEKRAGVVLGSFKDGAWGSVVSAVKSMRSSGINVLSPVDTRRTDIAINDGDFYYLQADLERVGLTEDDLKGLSETAIAVKLGFVPLQRDVLKNIYHMESTGYVYLAAESGKLGRSSAHELVVAGLTGKRLAMSSSIEEISPKVYPETQEFLKKALLPRIPIVTCDNLQSSDIDSQFIAPKIDISRREAYHLFRRSVNSLLKPT